MDDPKHRLQQSIRRKQLERLGAPIREQMIIDLEKRCRESQSKETKRRIQNEIGLLETIRENELGRENFE